MASKDMNQVLYEQLKCRVCENGPKAGKYEWYQCLSNHRICQDCKTGDTKDLNKCPCGRFISSEHCPMVEELLKLKTSRFKCKNTKNGCREFLEKEAMISHEMGCIYRLVNCPYSNCQLNVPFRKLIQHTKTDKHITCSRSIGIKESLSISQRLSKKTHFETGNFSCYPIKITCDSNIFLSTCQEIKGTLYHWIHFLGSPLEAKKYAYTLEYKDVTDSETNFTYNGRAISIDETTDSIKVNYKCLSVAYGFFKSHFVDNDYKFKYSLKIRNLKEEAKDDNAESGISDDE